MSCCWCGRTWTSHRRHWSSVTGAPSRQRPASARSVPGSASTTALWPPSKPCCPGTLGWWRPCSWTWPTCPPTSSSRWRTWAWPR
ncbi:hypothetical protein RLOC_00010767 [Lonchura striata]|uniref:Uncharacterized protein n=1 Tax=Lonchura striata TaxID=40157 RepID=A0A218UMW0_9PASE|nr:hypothetical protein RLOC_00010767 [Lonchura striata domestica]